MDEPEMPGKSARAALRILSHLVLCSVAAGTLLGCAAQREQKEQVLALAQMSRWLPGTYNNVWQHDADVRAGRPPHDAIAVAIVPIDSPIMGAHAFYMQEMAADDPRRVMKQQILTFELVDKGRIKESVASLVEPRRWRDANQNPEVLTALVLDDVTPLSGCDLFWTKTPDGFVGANDSVHCHSASQASESAARTQLRAELKATELSLSEQSYDADGTLVHGRTDEPYYRLRRGAVRKP